MSAYIVDPRTIDYLVQWAHYRASRDTSAHLSGPLQLTAIERFPQAVQGYRLYPGRMTADEMGQLLISENVRSVQARYPNDGPDDLPGPCDQTRVWRYRHHLIPTIHGNLKPTWVIKSCDCLDYQSCETDDWRETLAYAVLQAIRESGVDALVGDDAPWGVTDEDLQPKVKA